MLKIFLIIKTQVIAQNCGAWKLVAMALNKAQGVLGTHLKKMEDWKFREITISLAIAGLQKLRIIAQGQLQHIFVQ
jgi:hypothetical protein